MLEMVREDYVGDADSRAMADLDANARAMHAHGWPPHEMLRLLWRQAALWRCLGAELPADVALATIRQLPGMEAFDPAADFRERWQGVDVLVDGIETVSPESADEAYREHRRQRAAYYAAAWLWQNAGTPLAEQLIEHMRDFWRIVKGDAA